MFDFLEIPLFHVLHARITFGNIFGLDDEVPGVQRINDNGKINCIVSDSCFEPPPGYAKIGKLMATCIFSHFVSIWKFLN